MTMKKQFNELSSDEAKELKIEFVPGCFDHFDGTQEELDELIAEIKTMFARGEVPQGAEIITADNFDDLPEAVQQQLARVLLDPEDQHLIPPARPLQ